MLGGTGHIGAAVARRFAEAGDQVFAVGRHDRPRPNLAGTSVTVLTGDDRQVGSIETWIANADVVVDAGTPYPLWLHDGPGDAMAEAIGRARRAILAAQQQGADYVLISSFTTLPRPRGVLGQVGQGILQGLHGYFELKRAVEAEVLSALGRGLRGCVVNPAACFGPFDMKPREHTFIPLLLAGEVRGIVRHDLNVIDVRDLADVVFAAVGKGYPMRQIPVFGHSQTVAELAADICRIGGVAPPILQVPPLLGLAGLYWTETAMALAGRKTPWPSLTMMLVAAGYTAEPSPAQLSLSPHLRPLRDTIRDAIEWYRQIGRIT